MKKHVFQIVFLLMLTFGVLIVTSASSWAALVVSNSSLDTLNQPTFSKRTLILVVVNYAIIIAGLLCLVFEVVWIRRFYKNKMQGFSTKASLIWSIVLPLIILVIVYFLLTINFDFGSGGINIRLTL